MSSKCPTWHPETNEHHCRPANCNTSQKTHNLLSSVITCDESWIKVITKDILQSTFIWKSDADTILLTQKALFFSKEHLRGTPWMESTMPKHHNCFLKCTFQQETWVPNKTVVFIPRQCICHAQCKTGIANNGRHQQNTSKLSIVQSRPHYLWSIGIFNELWKLICGLNRELIQATVQPRTNTISKSGWSTAKKKV